MKMIFILMLALPMSSMAADQSDFTASLAKRMVKQGRENVEKEFGKDVFGDACKTTISALASERINYLQSCIDNNQKEVDLLSKKLLYNHEVFKNIRYFASLTGLDERVMDKAIEANRKGHDLGHVYWYFLNMELNNDGRASAVIYEEYLSMAGCKKLEVESIYYKNCSDFLIENTEIQVF